MFVPPRHVGRRQERKLEPSSIFSTSGLCFNTGPHPREGTVRQRSSPPLVFIICLIDGTVNRVLKGSVGLKKA